jgi:tetratricopeptide (TPR) repeat protein
MSSQQGLASTPGRTGRRWAAILDPLRRRPRRTLLVIGLLALTAPVAYHPWRILRARQDFDGARSALEVRDFIRARELLVRFLQVHPNSYPGHLLMAQVSRRAGFLDEAQVQLDLCQVLGGLTNDVHRERLLIDVQEGDLAAELFLWSQIEEAGHDAPVILEALAKGYRKNYLLEKMLTALNPWIEAKPRDVEPLLMRAWVHERKADFSRALEDLDVVVRLAPEHVQARLSRANVYLLAARPAEAHAEFQTLRERQPAGVDAGLGLAQSLRKLGKPEEAAQLLGELTRRHPLHGACLRELGQCLLDLHRPGDAEPIFRQALAHLPHDYQAHYACMQCLRQQGKTEEAEKVQARAKELETDMLLMAELTQKLQATPFDADLRCDIAKLLLRSGADKEGLVWLKANLRMDPDHAATRRALADYHAQQRPRVAPAAS